MSKITNSALELVGDTPLLHATRYADKAKLGNVEILTKLEEKERNHLEQDHLDTGYEIDNYHLDLNGRDYLKLIN